jgi:hypothetical protein
MGEQSEQEQEQAHDAATVAHAQEEEEVEGVTEEEGEEGDDPREGGNVRGYTLGKHSAPLGKRGNRASLEPSAGSPDKSSRGSAALDELRAAATKVLYLHLEPLNP